METRLLTSGDIAVELDCDVGQVRYILGSRRDIRPVGRAGLVRLYRPDVIARVGAEIRAIAEKRERVLA